MEQLDQVAIYASYDITPAFKRRLRKAGFLLTSRDGTGSYYHPSHWRYIGMGIEAKVDEAAMKADPEYARIEPWQNDRARRGDFFDAFFKLREKYITKDGDPGDFWCDQDAWKALTPEAKAWADSV